MTYIKTILLSTIVGLIKRSSCCSAMSGECLASAATANNTYQAGTHSIAYVTTPNEDVAVNLANGLVTNKLAACVNIIPQITSIYTWEGKINKDSEVLMMIKTRSSVVVELIDFVKKNHPHTVPEIIVVPIAAGSDSYLKWLGEAVPQRAQLKN